MESRPIKGMPYAPDLRRLEERWPMADMKPGDVFGYQEVADVIDEKVSSYRWKGVTTSWRRRLAKHDIHIECPGQQTFRVMDNSGKLRASKSKQDSATRLVRKSINLHASVDRSLLDEMEQKQHDVIAIRNSAFAAAAQIRGDGSDQKRLT